MKKYKSKEYLEFLGGKRCVVTGSKHPDLHHESVGVYKGMHKRWFDFGAIPLNHDVHINQRHSMGAAKFWKRHKKNPLTIAIKQVEEYLDTHSFSTEEEYCLATDALEILKAAVAQTTT